MTTAIPFHSQTILLVSDSAPIAQAMEQFIFNGLAMRVVARLQSFDNISDAIERFAPNVMIAYFAELGAERIERVRLAANTAPNLSILVISSTMASSLVREVFQVGARGYLLDMPSREELLSALETMREKRIALDVRLRATVEGRQLLAAGW